MTRIALENITKNPSDNNGIQWIALGTEYKTAQEFWVYFNIAFIIFDFLYTEKMF